MLDTRSAPSLPRPTRLYRLGSRRLTRAHLALAQRPTFRADAAKALAAVGAALAQQLGVAVTPSAALVDNEVRLARTFADGSAFALVELGPPDVRAVVEVEKAFLASILGRLSSMPGECAPTRSLTRIEEVAFGYVVLVCVEALKASEPVFRRFAPRLLAVLEDRADVLARAEARQPHLCVEVSLTIGPSSGVVRVMLPALAVQAALQDIPAQAPGAPAPEVMAAQVSVTPTMGCIQLELNELMGLAVGDVAVFDGVRLLGGQVCGPCRLLGPAFEIAGELGPSGFTVARAVSRALPQESSMSAPKPVPARPADATVTTLPVDVEVELTRLKLSLGDLGALRPGAVLPLRINAADPVLLRVGDRAVARAELVEIENEVGARILNLLPER